MPQTTERYLPPIVPRDDYRAARADLLVKEKAHMRAGDALAAERRRLPAVEITKPYTFATADGPMTLADFFGDRDQLIVYHFMFHPSWSEGCVGCSMNMDHMGPIVHLHARNIAYRVIARAELPTIQAYWTRMGWDIPVASSFDSDFNQDMRMTVDDQEDAGFSTFLKTPDGRILRTYFQGNRGNEAVLSTLKLLDLTPYGRRETWEDSPDGIAQDPAGSWWQRHDDYDHAKPASPSHCH